MATGNGFHVDSNGNVWIGSTRTTFDATTRSEAPFYIYANGDFVANGGTFSGSISGSGITGGTINIGNGTFQVDSSGNLTATSATLSGYLGVGSDFDDLAESGSIVGWVLDSANGRFVGQNGSGQYIYLDSSGNIAGNYTQGSAGWRIAADGTAEFQDVIARGTISGTVDTNLFIGSGGNFKSSSGTSRVEVAGSNPASLFWIKSSSTTGSIQASADEFIIQSYTGDTLTLNAGVGQTDTLNLNSGTLNIKNDTAIVTNTGTSLSLGGSTGNSGQVLKSNGSGLSWANVSTLSTFSNTTNQMTINNSNGTINLSIGNNSNTLSVGHNHPYGTSNLGTHGDGDHNALSYAASSHGHNAYALSGHGHGNTYAFYEHYHDDRYVLSSNHSHSNFASNNYVNGQITSHVLDYWSGHNSSDRRVKTDIVDTTLGLDFINRLQPRDFNWTDDYKSQLDNYVNPVADRQKELISNIQQGFIAQEVQAAVFAETGSNNAFSGVAIKNITADEVANYPADDPYGKINYESFVVPLVKAVQQLSAKIDVLEARIDELEGV